MWCLVEEFSIIVLLVSGVPILDGKHDDQGSTFVLDFEKSASIENIQFINESGRKPQLKDNDQLNTNMRVMKNEQELPKHVGDIQQTKIEEQLQTYVQGRRGTKLVNQGNIYLQRSQAANNEQSLHTDVLGPWEMELENLLQTTNTENKSATGVRANQEIKRIGQRLTSKNGYEDTKHNEKLHIMIEDRQKKKLGPQIRIEMGNSQTLDLENTVPLLWTRMRSKQIAELVKPDSNSKGPRTLSHRLSKLKECFSNPSSFKSCLKLKASFGKSFSGSIEKLGSWTDTMSRRLSSSYSRKPSTAGQTQTPIKEYQAKNLHEDCNEDFCTDKQLLARKDDKNNEDSPVSRRSGPTQIAVTPPRASFNKPQSPTPQTKTPIKEYQAKNLHEDCTDVFCPDKRLPGYHDQNRGDSPVPRRLQPTQMVIASPARRSSLLTPQSPTPQSSTPQSHGKYYDDDIPDFCNPTPPSPSERPPPEIPLSPPRTQPPNSPPTPGRAEFPTRSSSPAKSPSQVRPPSPKPSLKKIVSPPGMKGLSRLLERVRSYAKQRSLPSQ